MGRVAIVWRQKGACASAATHLLIDAHLDLGPEPRCRPHLVDVQLPPRVQKFIRKRPIFSN